MKFYYFVIFTELVKVPERVGKVGQDDQSPPQSRGPRGSPDYVVASNMHICTVTMLMH